MLVPVEESWSAQGCGCGFEPMRHVGGATCQELLCVGPSTLGGAVGSPIRCIVCMYVCVYVYVNVRINISVCMYVVMILIE